MIENPINFDISLWEENDVLTNQTDELHKNLQPIQLLVGVGDKIVIQGNDQSEKFRVFILPTLIITKREEMTSS